jgi:threonine synthase
MSLWRYRQRLPLRHDANIVSLGEGWTPLLHATRLGEQLGHPHIYIKDERQNPTGSFKDRQASLAISLMKEAGVQEAVVSSVGNVAIAYAAYAARAGIKLWVFVPSTTPEEKVRETAVYGTKIIRIPGTYDETKQAAAAYAQENNLFLDRGIKGIAAKEAMKTIAFELAEQLGDNRSGSWQAPDWYLQSVSGGLGPVGVMKGFQELLDLGLVDKMPKLGCVQADGCAPMVKAFQQKRPLAHPVIDPQTNILTLTTGNPGEAYEVLFELMSQHGGDMISVSDEEAYQSLHCLAQTEGISVEPATAVTFAGLAKFINQGIIRPDETVVVNCSGHTMPVSAKILGAQSPV